MEYNYLVNQLSYLLTEQRLNGTARLPVKKNPVFLKSISNKTCAYRVPFGHHALLLEARELPAIMDGGRHLPQHEQSETDEHDSCDHTEHNAQDRYLEMKYLCN